MKTETRNGMGLGAPPCSTLSTRREEVKMLVEKVRTYPENFMHFLAGEIEEMDRNIVHLCDVLEIVRAENAALRALVKSAHEWGANGTKGYDAGAAIAFEDSARMLLKGEG